MPRHLHYMLLCLLLAIRSLVFGQKDGLITVGKLQVHYQIHGKGAPIVFLHAGYQDINMWDQQVAYFSKYNTVITIDLPGHGKTKGKDTSLLIKDVLRICLDSLQIKKASFVGLSLGGACVQDFVLAYPEKVDKAVLVGSGLSGWAQVIQMDTVSKQIFVRMDSIVVSNNPDSFARQFTQIWGIGPSRKPESVSPEIRDYVFRTTLANLKEHPEDNRWPQLDSPRAATLIHYQQWKRPLLIIYGDQDVPFIITEAHWLHASIKASREVMIPHVAHMSNMEQPLVFNRIVRSFLISSPGPAQ